MKKIISLVLILAMLSSFVITTTLSASAAGTATLSLKTDQETYKPGDTVNLTVILSELTTDIGAFLVNVKFPETLTSKVNTETKTGYEWGSAVEGLGGDEAIYALDDRIALMWIKSYNEITDNGSLISLFFEIPKNAPEGEYDFEFGSIDFATDGNGTLDVTVGKKATIEVEHKKATISISTDYSEHEPGETVKLSVNLSDLKGHVGAFAFGIEFPEEFECKAEMFSSSGYVLGSIIKNPADFTVNVVENKIWLVYAFHSTNGILENGKIVTIEFFVPVNTADGNYNFEIITGGTDNPDFVTYDEFQMDVTVGAKITVAVEQLPPPEYSLEPYMSGNDHVWKITPGTTVGMFISSLTDLDTGISVEIFDTNGKKQNNAENVGTGMVVKVLKRGVVIEEFNVVIFGDVSGDGIIGAMDLLIIKKHLLNIQLISMPYFFAANISGNGYIGAVDLLIIKKHLLRLENIRQDLILF